MYKLRFLVRLGLLFLIALGFNGCDGRKSSQQALKEHVKAFKNDIKIEVTEFYPKARFVSIKDTLLTSGHSVKIKTYSDMQNSVTLTQIKDSANYQKHYRNFIFEVELRDDSKILLNERFTHDRILELIEHPSVYDTQSVLKNIDLNFVETTNDRVQIDLMYEVPESDKRYLFLLSLDKYGIIRLERK